MTVAELAEIFVCVLAVWGLYCILRSIAGFFVNRNKMSVGVHIEPNQDVYELVCAVKSAQLLTDKKSVFEQPPVLLSDVNISRTEIEEYKRLGVDIYFNHNLYKNVN